MIAATFWAVVFVVLTSAASLGALCTLVRNAFDEVEAVLWVPFFVALVLVAALSAGAAAAFASLAGWS